MGAEFCQQLVDKADAHCDLLLEEALQLLRRGLQVRDALCDLRQHAWALADLGDQAHDRRHQKLHLRLVDGLVLEQPPHQTQDVFGPHVRAMLEVRDERVQRRILALGQRFCKARVEVLLEELKSGGVGGRHRRGHLDVGRAAPVQVLAGQPRLQRLRGEVLLGTKLGDQRLPTSARPLGSSRCRRLLDFQRRLGSSKLRIGARPHHFVDA
mmetsp:Transcript_38170/g.109758  ORF Transcript_38170/g.109758 Transcript_38170/m.109758 type:complete len:211 (+) Transcript_38170:972-1604(+)